MSSQPKQPAIEKIFQIIAQMTGFVIATLVNFVKTVFKEIVTSEEKLIDEAALKASPMQTAQAVSEGGIQAQFQKPLQSKLRYPTCKCTAV